MIARLRSHGLRVYSVLPRIPLFFPFGWFVLFLLLPLLIVFGISLTEPAIQVPPFIYPIHIQDHHVTIRLDFSNLIAILRDPFYLSSIFKSFELALCATISCLVFGYAMAYSLLQLPPVARLVALIIVVLPFWTSFIIRIYAWMGLLSQLGWINQLLLKLHLIVEPIQFLGNDYAVWIGMTYCYMPFMIFPIYASLSKISPCYLEAAYNLGCSPWRGFWRITLPLSAPGIRAGCLFVFLPTIGEFVIPELLGGINSMTIGRVLWMEFFNNRNWPLACGLAFLLVFFFLIFVNFIGKKHVYDEL
jgi:putrescine transport system permease protein